MPPIRYIQDVEDEFYFPVRRDKETCFFFGSIPSIKIPGRQSITLQSFSKSYRINSLIILNRSKCVLSVKARFSFSFIQKDLVLHPARWISVN